MKTAKYDESVIDLDNYENYFYFNSDLFDACYNTAEDSGSFYLYFENNNYIMFEIDDEIYNTRKKLDNYILSIMSPKLIDLEKRIRLITNLDIGLPNLIAKIYDNENKLLTYVGIKSNCRTSLRIQDYTNEMKDLLVRRLNFRITKDTILELEENNNRYKRALAFYNSSFTNYELGLKFCLLFSCLEALFNLDENDIKKTVSKYTSKLLFESSKITKKYNYSIRELYNARSSYIHGNDKIIVTKEMEFELREIVREILLLYWSISQRKDINKAEDVIKFLDKNNRTTIELQLQIFKKSLHITNYKKFYEEVRKKLINGKTNILIDK